MRKENKEKTEESFWEIYLHNTSRKEVKRNEGRKRGQINQI